MSEEIYDPYDVSNYINPISKSKKNKPITKSANSPSTHKPANPEKNIFNPYNNSEQSPFEEEPEKKPTQKKTKKKREEENIPQNIDLDEEEENKNTNNEDEDELPLLQELGIDLSIIKGKIIGVLTLKKIDKKFFADSDMAGPFLIFIIFAFSLVLHYKTCFGYIYGVSVFGSLMIFLVLNLMAKNNNSILLYDTISVLGYCLIPIVLLSFFSIFFNVRSFAGHLISVLIVVFSSLSASKLFGIALEMDKQKWLIFYPVLLFYTCFVLVTIF